MRNKLVIMGGAALLALMAGAWLAYPMDAVGWAAWVQTAGVVTAIWWSVRLQARQADQHVLQATRVAVVFATNLHWAFRRLNDASGNRSWPEFVVNRRILDEILSQGRNVPVHMLEGRALAMVSSLRAMGVEALEVSAAHQPNGDWREMQSYFAKRLPSISAWLSANGSPPESNGPTDYLGLRSSFSQIGQL